VADKKPEELKEEGMARFNRGHHDEALVIFQQAAKEYREAEDLLGQGEMLNNIGVIYRLDRNLGAAEEALNQANKIFSELGDEVRQAQVLGNLGDLSSRRKDYLRAEQYYSESSALFAGAGEYTMQADVLRMLSLMQIRKRNLWAAVDAMQRSLKVRPKMSIPQRMLSLLLSLATKILSGGQ
jgi:tetratricopeptide (TPR) repeat protein